MPLKIFHKNFLLKLFLEYQFLKLKPVKLQKLSLNTMFLGTNLITQSIFESWFILKLTEHFEAK